MKPQTAPDMPWCTLQAAPHHELQVCNQLCVLRLENYAPEFPKSSRTRAGSVRDTRHRWVFPGYVFFRGLQDLAAWETVHWMHGVVRVLLQDDVPALLSDVVIRQLHKRIAEGRIQPPESQLARGQPVLIAAGPLAAVDAIFDRELNTSDRVQILVQLFGRELPVSIDRAHLQLSRWQREATGQHRNADELSAWSASVQRIPTSIPTKARSGNA